MLNLRTILVAADFSACSEDAFRVARALDHLYQARLVVLHVIAPDQLHEGLQPDGHRAELEKRLRLVYAADATAPVEYRIRDSDPAEEVLAVARETLADLIVMGTHGRSGLRRVMVGSVAEKVLRQAPCLVLTVKCTDARPNRVEEAVTGETHLAAGAAPLP